MENMSDTKNENVQQEECSFSSMSDINDDIIDVSSLDFSDAQTWLQPPSRSQTADGISDLDAWLKDSAEQDCDSANDSRKSIDTRTFTRPKKRSGRLSFDYFGEANATQSLGVWNPQMSPSGSPKPVRKFESSQCKRDTIPAMLRPANAATVNIFSSTSSTMNSGQESLEAFLNMSQSKGIDSFIDLAEPEFNDDIMDTSQPSVLYSSVLSVTTDESSRTSLRSASLDYSRRSSGIEDSQILTESMMQTSMFGDVVDVNFNDPFAKSNSNNVTVVENKNFESSTDLTFVAPLETKSQEPINSMFETMTLEKEDFESLDVTYTPSRFDSTLKKDPHSSYVVATSPSERSDANTPIVSDKRYFVDSPKSTHEKRSIEKKELFKDTSYVVRSSEIINKANFLVDNKVTNDTSYIVTRSNIGTSLRRTFNLDTEEVPKDASFVVKPATPDIPDDQTFSLQPRSPHSQNSTFNLRHFDATFDKKSNVGSAEQPVDRTISKSPAGTTVSDRCSLEEENLDATLEILPLSPSIKSAASLSSGRSSPELTTNRQNAINETFKAPSCEKLNLPVQKSVEVPKMGGSLENLGTTFSKPPRPEKLHSKLHPPRQLSRLPQSFQKSNPNLGSNSLKYGASAIARPAVPHFGFNRAPRTGAPRNTENLQITSKLLPLGKVKSGSEQRLDLTRNVADLQMTGNGGSTESIDSTQSAHSAPDFDDRLSVRSDGSNNSYNRTMNIEDLQKIVHIRGECLIPESTPKPNRRIMENNWVTSNELLSPILKNDPATYSSRGSSPRSTDSTVKTSSPLLSPEGSLQNLPMDTNSDNREGHKLPATENKTVQLQQKSQLAAKPPRTAAENKTGLRPPGSWTSANRQASGIPRPASRIPAPRFVRPNAKISQGDAKK